MTTTTIMKEALIDRRKDHNREIRDLMYVGDSLARTLIDLQRHELPIMWQLCAAGVTLSGLTKDGSEALVRYTVAVQLTGNAMATALEKVGTITAAGAASAWRRMAKEYAE